MSFLIKQTIHPNEIPDRSWKVHKDGAMKRADVFCLVSEVQRWREDLWDKQQHRTQAPIDLDDRLVSWLQRNAHTKARTWAAAIAISD
jgi:hypothetical protein